MNSFMESLRDFERKVDHLLKAQRIVIFGASSGGLQALEMLNNLNKSPSFFTDNDQGKWEKYVNGIRVVPPTELKVIDPDVIIIGSKVYEDEMMEQLSSYGLRDRAYSLDFLELLLMGKFLSRLFEKLR